MHAKKSASPVDFVRPGGMRGPPGRVLFKNKFKNALKNICQSIIFVPRSRFQTICRERSPQASQTTILHSKRSQKCSQITPKSSKMVPKSTPKVPEELQSAPRSPLGDEAGHSKRSGTYFDSSIGVFWLHFWRYF